MQCNTTQYSTAAQPSVTHTHTHTHKNIELVGNSDVKYLQIRSESLPISHSASPCQLKQTIWYKKRGQNTLPSNCNKTVRSVQRKKGKKQGLNRSNNGGVVRIPNVQEGPRMVALKGCKGKQTKQKQNKTKQKNETSDW